MNLFTIPVLATALSLVICWALFAIFCSLLHEAVVQIKAERGRFLKKYLHHQLQDVPNGINWASLLYMHGAVDLMSRAPNKPTSEISPRLFAETLIDVVGSSHAVQMNAAAVNVNLQNKMLRDFKAAVLVLKPSDVVSFLRQALQSAEITARGDEAILYAELVKNIEAWYDDLGKRVTVWYKKQTRARLFWTGLLAAIIINVDSIQLFDHFNKNPAAREVVISYYEKNAERLGSMAAELESETRPDSEQKEQLDSIRARVTVYARQIDSLAREADLPIGFKHLAAFKKESVVKTNGFGAFMLKLIGVLLSGFAASFGAPFWFDLLKKVYTKRS